MEGVTESGVPPEESGVGVVHPAVRYNWSVVRTGETGERI